MPGTWNSQRVGQAVSELLSFYAADEEVRARSVKKKNHSVIRRTSHTPCRHQRASQQTSSGLQQRLSVVSSLWGRSTLWDTLVRAGTFRLVPETSREQRVAGVIIPGMRINSPVCKIITCNLRECDTSYWVEYLHHASECTSRSWSQALPDKHFSTASTGGEIRCVCVVIVCVCM